jgi:hypothetical protein
MQGPVRANARRYRGIFLAALMLMSVLAAPGVVGQGDKDIEGGNRSGVAPLRECDLEVHTPFVGADRNSEQALKVILRNPFGSAKCSIWQFIFSLDQSYGIDWVLGEEKSFLKRDRSEAPWVVKLSDDCDGPEIGTFNPPSAGPGPCDSIIFTAPKKAEIRPGGFVEFQLTVKLDGSTPYCTKIPVEVMGVHTEKKPLGTSSYFTHTKQFETQIRNFSIVADNTLQEAQMLPLYTYIVDEDHNGHIDHAGIQFNKELDPSTFDVRDWNIGRKTPTSDEYAVLKGDIMDPPVPAPAGEYCPENSFIWLKFEEEDVYDTGGNEFGEMPEVVYKKTNDQSRTDARIHRILTTLAGERVLTQDPAVPADKSLPVLTSAIIHLDKNDPEFNTRVLVTFSENVQQQAGCAGAASPITTGDLAFSNKSNSVESLDKYAFVYPPHETGTPRFWINFYPNGLHDIPEDGALRIQDLEYRFEQDVSASLNTIEPNAQPHRILPGDSICDINGNAAWRHASCTGTAQDWINCWPALREPSIISVDGNIAFNKVTVRFASAVNMTPEFLAQPHRLFTVKNGFGPSGVVHMDFTQGSDHAVLTLDKNLTTADVTGDATYLSILGNNVWSAWTERNNGTDDGIPWYLPTQDQYFVDVTPPSIMFALTRDRDQNGELDGYDLIFSEPIVDISFKEGKPDDQNVILGIEDHTDYRRLDLGSPDDRFMSIGMVANNATRGYATHRTPELTAIQKFVGDNITQELRGLVADQAVDRAKPEENLGNWMENITSADIIELDGAPPRVMDAHTVDRDENGRIDGMVLIFSEPVRDSTFNPAHFTVIGKLDRHYYKVQGAMPLNGIDPKNEWDYFANDPIIVLLLEERPLNPAKPAGDTGQPVPDVKYFAPEGEGLEDLAGLPYNVGPEIILGGPNRMLNFDGGKVNERDEARPVLMAALGCEGESFLKVVFSEGVAVQENVGQPQRGILERDLFYENGNGNISRDGKNAASGIKTGSVRHTVGSPEALLELEGVVFTEDFGRDKLRIAPDVRMNETVSVVKEVAGRLQTEHETVALSESEDIFNPEGIKSVNISVDPVSGAEKISAATAELNWVIPHDQGCRVNAGVVAYDIRVQNTDSNQTALTAANFELVENPEYLSASYWWYDERREKNFTGTPFDLFENQTVGEGKTLQVRLSGLEPDTNYQLAIKTLDKAANKGPMSPVIEFKTKRDPTPPVKPDDWALRSSTHTSGVPSKNPLPKFDWDPAVDPESLFPVYVFRMSQNPDDVPDLQSDFKVGPKPFFNFTAKNVAEIAPGPNGLGPSKWFEEAQRWYFHLSACSGGGCTKLGKFDLRIDSPINRTEMLEANRKISTAVVYDAGSKTATVTWEMPSGEGLPCQPVGAQVWRRDQGGQYQLLGTFGKNDGEYKDGIYVDDSDGVSKKSRYLVTMICPERVVTYFDAKSGTFQGTLVEGAGKFPEKNSPPIQDYEGFSSEVKKAKPNLLWLWILLGVLALLLVTALVVYMVMRGRGEQELWEEAEIDEEEAATMGGEAAADGDAGAGGAGASDGWSEESAEAGPPVHDVKCPSCAHEFQATGDFPLKISCPNCGTSGTMRG